jgi:Putative prokaryotic signal transducing protein
MKPLHTARHATEAHVIRGYLESQGIDALIRGEFLAGAIGELPADQCRIYVLNDGEFARAQTLLREFLRGDAERLHAHEQWQCACCHETIEGQFTDCWKCGAARPA